MERDSWQRAELWPRRPATSTCRCRRESQWRPEALKPRPSVRKT